MTSQDEKILRQDPDGLITYEYLANNIDTCGDDLRLLVDNLIRVDRSGQFTASTARYLQAIDSDKYSEPVRRLVSATIDKDREHRYLPDLLPAIYGADYEANAAALQSSDNNFRRIYKRLFPNPEHL